MARDLGGLLMLVMVFGCGEASKGDDAGSGKSSGPAASASAPVKSSKPVSSAAAPTTSAKSDAPPAVSGSAEAAAPAPSASSAPAASGDAYLQDGWPATIPPKGSKPPTVAEWNAQTKEVTVGKSSDLNCETKMIREWLRVSCHKNQFGLPQAVNEKQAMGQQALPFADKKSVASLVLEVFEGSFYKAEFQWEKKTVLFELHWTTGARPEAHFNL